MKQILFAILIVGSPLVHGVQIEGVDGKLYIHTITSISPDDIVCNETAGYCQITENITLEPGEQFLKLKVAYGKNTTRKLVNINVSGDGSKLTITGGAILVGENGRTIDPSTNLPVKKSNPKLATQLAALGKQSLLDVTQISIITVAKKDPNSAFQAQPL